MKQNVKTTFLLAALTAGASSAHAIVNFETQGPLTDNAVIGLNADFTEGPVTFRFGVDTTGVGNGIVRNQSVFLEGTGDADPLNGFAFDQGGVYDTQNPIWGGLGLDDWFLRTEPVGSGGNSLDGPGVFVIEYTTGTPTQASGQIWDIDGNLPSPGTEQYSVTAYAADGTTVLDTDTSPTGNTNTLGSLDGLPWEFSIASPGDLVAIKYIVIDFTGTKTTNIGLAFDNFNATGQVIPEPSTYALLFGAFALTSVMLRRRRD